MHFLIEIAYEPAAADSLRTLALEAGERFSAAMSGKRSEGFAVEGSWVALESCAAYLIVDARDGVPVYELCREITRCATGIKARLIPVLPIERLKNRLGLGRPHLPASERGAENNLILPRIPHDEVPK
jgi:hypothetical protein